MKACSVGRVSLQKARGLFGRELDGLENELNAELVA